MERSHPLRSGRRKIFKKTHISFYKGVHTHKTMSFLSLESSQRAKTFAFPSPGPRTRVGPSTVPSFSDSNPFQQSP